MITPDGLCAELQATWHREIPLAAAIGVGPIEFAPNELVVHAPMAPNVNVHGTVFAGSLFSICVLAGWGGVWLALRRAGLNGRIVAVDSRIDYRKAVVGDIACRCRLDPAAIAGALVEIEASGRATLPMACTVDGPKGRAVDFLGTYAVRVRPPPAVT